MTSKIKWTIIAGLSYLFGLHPPTEAATGNVLMPIDFSHLSSWVHFRSVERANEKKGTPWSHPADRLQLFADSIQEERDHAHALRDKVEQLQQYRESLDANSVIDLPVGIGQAGGPVDYMILIDKITFGLQGATVRAYLSLTLPQTGDQIAFGGQVPLSRDGGIVGNARIYLLGDHVVSMSGSQLLTLKGGIGAQSFVELDCNGFKGMSIEAELKFSRDVILPEDEEGNVIDGENVKFNFQTYLQDWNELLVKIDIPPFQMRGLPDIGFKVQDAYLDWSDIANPNTLVFPSGYQNAYLSSGNLNLWRGIFIREAEVRLPKKLSNAGTSERTSFGATNLILDETGFSGILAARNLVDAGNMRGWNFTVDDLSANLVSNQVQSFRFKGDLQIPAFKKGDESAKMGYQAVHSAAGPYIFNVTIEENLKLPLWAADVSLYPGSSVIVTERNHQFYPSASLNGMLAINTSGNGPSAKVGGIRFEHLVLSTEEPYFRPGTFGVGAAEENATISSFPLVINNIGVKSDSVTNRAGLSLDVSVNITGSAKEEGFSGTAGLIVWGELHPPPSENKSEGVNAPVKSDWTFDKVELTALAVAARKPGVYQLQGEIVFFDDDPVYGKGFHGVLNGTFKDKITVSAEALFGRTTEFRYWYADALVSFKSGIQLAPGFAAYGFGGGFYSRMKQRDPSQSGSARTTLSGISYVPDPNSMGLRAYVAFGSSPKKEALNGDVTLEIAMNGHGGINQVSLIGNAYFLTPGIAISDDLVKAGASEVTNVSGRSIESSPRSQVYGHVSLMYDNENDVFHGNIEVYLNVAGGLVKGIGDGNKAGWAILHFSPGEWYVLIGTPDQPIGLEVARLFKSESYFMMGQNLPGSPPPPSKVSEILGQVDLDYMRDMNALQSGFGFAFGMHFGVDTGDLRFLMFYGSFSAGTGFDIMIKNYGTEVHCEGDSGPLGVNGWYANGQAYAYIEGKIGIKVNLKFYKGDYEILAIGAAAVLQVKGPNPFWMRGTVGGYYRILGGLVKGHCQFDVTVGKECKPVGESNPLQDVSMIAASVLLMGRRKLTSLRRRRLHLIYQ